MLSFPENPCKCTHQKGHPCEFTENERMLTLLLWHQQTSTPFFCVGPLYNKYQQLKRHTQLSRLTKKMTATAVYGRAESRNLQRNMSSVVCASSMSSLHGNGFFSVCARMENAVYITFIMWNSSLDAWYHFRFNISCGVAVLGRSHQKKKFR